MDWLILQFLNGLDKGGAYALIALGLTLVFGTLGVVNFAHGALFMIGAFCAVVFSRLVRLETVTVDPERLSPWGTPLEVRTPVVELWLGDFGTFLVQYSVPLAILLAIPVMLLIGWAMERGLIRHFYKRTHAEQILVTFGLAIVLQEIVKASFGANAIPVYAPPAVSSSLNLSASLGIGTDIFYPWWRLIYLGSALLIIGLVIAFLQFTTYGMVIRAGMEDRQTVGFLGINIQKRFTVVFGIAAVVAGVAGVLYSPIVSPNYHLGMDFLVLSFVVVVVGGMGSIPGAVLAGFLLGIVESFASMAAVTRVLPAIDQVILYVVAIIVLLTLPRGLMGRKGVMEG
ncbi:branched-chain amino acid ABC transporter permease [Aquibaculum arenosum]|uniref:Branched-chain amino acid ABC transporter permease n=1 Tax=Aquibaculum arenosum TaxID=3032591 RepID=A0ABT5YHM6_9PROT|nr:branched-chain amino acid ABC transporter permease [Fodinicurvata sp. CAU 1616]MDF2094438.1 branched-chain amino acid ABC transporter permease [Fodinicurvata sp. CAU 1616]